MRLAVLPFDNLTSEGTSGEVMTVVFFTEVGARGDYEPVEAGIVAAALESLGVRTAGSLSAAQLKAIGESLGAPRLLVGSVLENGFVHTPEGDLPSVGVTLKLLDATSGRVLWTKMGFKTGDDGETVFGWGREKSPRKLAARLATDLLKDLPGPREPMVAPAVPPTDTTGAKKGMP